MTRVFYVTDRNDIPAAPSEQRYGAERGELACGTIDVSIPRDHRAGILETPSLRHLEFRPERDKHVVLLSVTRPPADFYAHLRQTVERSTGHDAFVLVAPDIDAGVFRQRARQILGTARHVAL